MVPECHKAPIVRFNASKFYFHKTRVYAFEAKLLQIHSFGRVKSVDLEDMLWLEIVMELNRALIY